MGSYSFLRILVGRTESCNFPTSIASVPVVASVKPDYEALARVGPDLVLYDKSLYGEQDIAKIEELGAETFVMDVNTLDEYIDFVYRLGAKSPDPIRFSRYVDQIVAARGEAQASSPNPKPTVAVLSAGPSGTDPLIAGVNSFQADEVRAAGGEPVGPDSEKFEPMQVEAFLGMNPDAIVVDGTSARVYADPRFRALGAVKNRKVIDVDPDVLLRAGARVDKLIRRLSAMLRQGGGE
jgi:iron complex transport system substrate-binding protein